MLLAGFQWEINPMAVHIVSGHATDWINATGWLSGKYIPWLDVEFLVILLAGFHWRINLMAGYRISGNATGWISLGSKSHGWMWTFQQCYWLDFTGKQIRCLEVEFPVMPLSGFHWEINPMDGHGITGNPTGWISLENKSHGWTWNLW